MPFAIEPAPVAIIKAVAAAGTAEPLTAVPTLATYIEVSAKKTAAVNAGNVFIGASTVVKAATESVELAPGDVWYKQARPGECFDLANIYIDADTTADGVAGFYTPAA